jgi:hypothetical protein
MNFWLNGRSELPSSIKVVENIITMDMVKKEVEYVEQQVTDQSIPDIWLNLIAVCQNINMSLL